MHLKGFSWGLNFLAFLKQLKQYLVLGQCYTSVNFYYNVDKSFYVTILHWLTAIKWESNASFWSLLRQLEKKFVTAYKAKTLALEF